MAGKLGLSTLREEHRLRVFENKVLRKISGPKRRTTGEWKKLKRGVSRYVILTRYCLGEQSKRDGMGGIHGMSGGK
jgi:hypothetical protein